MSGSPQAPRGTFDVLPEQSARRHSIEQLLREIAEPLGYRRIETPIFEASEVFSRGVGASTDVVQKEMYTFEDRGGRSITLRPEGTAGVVRSYIQHGMHKLPQPQKFWYFAPFFRYERAQAGRQREFWQFGIESLGSDDPSVDAEGIWVLHQLLQRAGVTGLRLRLGTLGGTQSRAAHREKLVEYLRANEEQLSEEVRGRIDLNPLRAFDSDHPGTQEVMKGAPLLLDYLTDEDAEHFAQVKQLLDQSDVSYEIDPTLVRGLDYYSRTLFEFTSDQLGAQSGVGGGGRYDGLAELLSGPHTPAFGWAAGSERILLAQDASNPQLPDYEESCDLYICWHDGARQIAFSLMIAAQQEGLSVRLDQAGRGLKGQMRRAARAGAVQVVTVGQDTIELRGEENPVAIAGDEQALNAEATKTVLDTVRKRIAAGNGRSQEEN